MNRILSAVVASIVSWCVVVSSAVPVGADELDDALKVLRSVGPKAENHAAAQQAWPIVSRGATADLPRVLAALDDAGPLAANWIRSAAEVIAQRARQSSDAAAAPLLETFVRDTAHRPLGRRLAFELLRQADPTAEARLMPSFLNDPSTELRREAVDRVVAEAEAAANDADKKSLYRRAYDAARDVDQVKQLAASLDKLGDKVDVPTHLGFITRWKLIGPFDNTGEKGFAVAYPPETEIRLDAKYPGKGGGEIAWIDFTTDDPYGDVDLNKALGKNKGAAAYAYAEFQSAQAAPVEFRIGAISAIKLWVNGKLLDSREVYHSGSEIDQYISRGELQPGVNRILVKVCENEQTENWAQDWKFQLRICDATGTAVLSQDRVASATSNSE